MSDDIDDMSADTFNKTAAGKTASGRGVISHLPACRDLLLCSLLDACAIYFTVHRTLWQGPITL